MSEWRSLSRDEKIEAITRELMAGCGSASEIARRVGTSRNAIIGACWRSKIKLPGRFPEDFAERVSRAQRIAWADPKNRALRMARYRATREAFAA